VALCGTILKRNTLASKMENGMLVDLRERVGRRDLLLFSCKATVSTLMILVTTVSCSTATADKPQPRSGIVEREQPRTSASPKVARVHTPKETSVSRPAAKKANTPPRLDTRREQQLFREFQEFLEWRRRQKDQP
jgi:hypothetical protein